METEEFIIRLEQLLGHYGISASAFADRIGVQRSGVSHLLSGRNKPSLDFILKITEAFPEVDIYWIIKGNGSMFGKPGVNPENQSTPLLAQPMQRKDEIPKIPLSTNINTDHAVERIIIFYTNGSFKEYSPKN